MSLALPAATFPRGNSSLGAFQLYDPLSHLGERHGVGWVEKDGAGVRTTFRRRYLAYYVKETHKIWATMSLGPTRLRGCGWGEDFGSGMTTQNKAH